MLTFLISVNTLVQISTPPELRGRVLAIYFAVNLGITPIGSPLVGWIGQVWGAMVDCGRWYRFDFDCADHLHVGEDLVGCGVASSQALAVCQHPRPRERHLNNNFRDIDDGMR